MIIKTGQNIIKQTDSLTLSTICKYFIRRWRNKNKYQYSITFFNFFCAILGTPFVNDLKKKYIKNIISAYVWKDKNMRIFQKLHPLILALNTTLSPQQNSRYFPQKFNKVQEWDWRNSFNFLTVASQGKVLPELLNFVYILFPNKIGHSYKSSNLNTAC